uniref:Uncharacterized protein n=1 Tax=Arundo donax TaxID=35708 RepID=A0A0A9D0E7_ARUDO
MLLWFLQLQSNNQQINQHVAFQYKNLNLCYLMALIEMAVVKAASLTVK